MPDINPLRVVDNEEISIRCANQCTLNIVTNPAGAVWDEEDEHGGIIRHIDIVDLSNDTVMPKNLKAGVTAHNRLGQPIVGTGMGGNADLPEGGKAGDLLAKRTDADFEMEWVTPATHSEADNTRPITAAAVYTEIGNINALLATI